VCVFVGMCAAELCGVLGRLGCVNLSKPLPFFFLDSSFLVKSRTLTSDCVKGGREKPEIVILGHH